MMTPEAKSSLSNNQYKLQTNYKQTPIKNSYKFNSFKMYLPEFQYLLKWSSYVYEHVYEF